MASLKEVKDRIASVGNIQKITSAMKMIASAKLHKAQMAIDNMLPYERRLNKILTDFLSSGVDYTNLYAVPRNVKHIAIVVFSSNTSLCGGFNANIIRQLTATLDGYKEFGLENVSIYPVGKKVAEAAKKTGIKIEGDYQNMAENPSYEQSVELAKSLMDGFKNGKYDKVELIYNHYHSTALQEIKVETYLPIQMPSVKEDANVYADDFIIEPSTVQLMDELIPKVLLMKIYTVNLDSNAAEHAARVMAMQFAMDNANSLLHDLTLAYNKGRQQSITNELLDIVGGSMA